MGARGPKPGTVRKPPKSGRQKGTRNQATQARKRELAKLAKQVAPDASPEIMAPLILTELKALARSYAPAAFEAIVGLLVRQDAPAVVLGAAKEIIDRGYGRTTQLIAGDPSEAPVKAELTVKFE